MFELLWLASPVFVFIFFFLPETSADNILLRRAARIRALTGNPDYKSQSEIKQANMAVKEVLFNALVKPWEMNILDPVILFSTVYVAFCYAIFYCFFEAFPIVFQRMHGFSLGSAGLTFLAVPLGLAIAIPAQLSHFKFYVEPFLMKHGAPVPEFWLKHTLIVSIFASVGLFIFGERSPEVMPKIQDLIKLKCSLDLTTGYSLDRTFDRSCCFPRTSLPHLQLPIRVYC